MSAGSYSRVPMGEAFDVMCRELDDIVNRMCGIEEVALAYAWMNRHSWKVPDRLGGEEAVGQAAGSSSAPTKGELERASSPPSLVGEPPSPTGTDSPEGKPVREPLASRMHSGGSPTRHLAAVPACQCDATTSCEVCV